MAVETTNALSGPFLPNGATLTFPFTFTAPSSEEVAVMLRAPDGTETAATGFSVALAPGGGGSVTFAVAPAAGPELFILLDPFFTQQIEFENGSGWLAEPVNEVADRGASRDQVLKRDISRALLAPLGESALFMPPAAGRAGNYLGFDALGRPVAAPGTGNDPDLRNALANAGGDNLLRFDPAGVGALPSTVGDTLRLAGVYPQHFGATGDGTTNDTDAFNKATVAAQALGLPLSVPAGHYRVEGWLVSRAGGGVEIRCSPKATFQLPDDAASGATLLEIKADHTKLYGGRFDGNIDVLPDGDRHCIKAYSEVSGDPLRGVLLMPDFVGNCSAQGILVLGGYDCHVKGVRAANTGLNGILFYTGNTAFVGYDTDVSYCSIEDCIVDRSMLASSAQQGGIKFSENGAAATAKEIIGCRIVNCVAILPETDGEHNGNVAIEIWAKGRDNLIEGCYSQGGYIGISMAKGNVNGIISNCHARRAQSIGLEAAGVDSCRIIGSTADCDDFTLSGVSLDYQSVPSEPGTGMACSGVTILKPALRGIVGIASAPTSANVWRGENISVSAHIEIGATANVKAVEFLNIKGASVDVYLDGANAAGSRGIVLDRCTDIGAKLRSRRLASNAFALIRGGAETTDNMHLEWENLDETGSSFAMSGGSGAFGAAISLKIKGPGYFSVVNANIAKLAAAYGDCLLTGGYLTGTPEANVEAAVGSMLHRIDGGAGTCLYIKEAAATASTGWVGK